MFVNTKTELKRIDSRINTVVYASLIDSKFTESKREFNPQLIGGIS